jgi:hypothetical protein
MSRFTKYLDKPASMAADAGVATATGAAAFVILQLVVPAIPLIGALGVALTAPASGVVAAATYLRARRNLLDPTPAWPPASAPS